MKHGEFITSWKNDGNSYTFSILTSVPSLTVRDVTGQTKDQILAENPNSLIVYAENITEDQKDLIDSDQDVYTIWIDDHAPN